MKARGPPLNSNLPESALKIAICSCTKELHYICWQFPNWLLFKFWEHSSNLISFISFLEEGGWGHEVNGVRVSFQTNKEVIIFSWVQWTIRVNETMLMTVICAHIQGKTKSGIWLAQLSYFMSWTHQAKAHIILPSVQCRCQLIQSPCVKIWKKLLIPFTPWHHCVYSQYCSLYISKFSE